MNNLFLATLLCLYSIAICGNLTFESTNGALSVNGQRMSIKGDSWFGFETGGKQCMDCGRLTISQLLILWSTTTSTLPESLFILI